MRPHTIAALALAALIGCSAATAAAQDAPNDPRSIVIRRTDREDSLILRRSRPTDVQSIPVPKFVVKTRDRSFMLTIGGKIMPVIGWDIKNNLYKTDAGINFTTQNIPVPATDGHKGDFFINGLNCAAVDFQIVGFAGTPNEITGYIKLKTNGNQNGINLNRAYISYRNFTVGEVATLFEDQDACQPPTIDPEGPCGIAGNTAYEVNYQSPSYGGFQWAIGLDMPSWYASNGVYRGHDYPDLAGHTVLDNADGLVPDIPAWIQFGDGGNNRVRISGLLRNFAYRDLVRNETCHTFGWGAMLSGNLNFYKPLVIYYQACYGHGIGAYLQDIAGMPLSFVPSNDEPGKMKASPMMGLSFGLSYNWTSKWQTNVMWSESRIWDVRNYATTQDGANYKYALYVAANVFYQVNNWLQCGVEYLWGHRSTWDLGGAHDNRIQAALCFTI